jgi:hypothetical protein
MAAPTTDPNTDPNRPVLNRRDILAFAGVAATTISASATQPAAAAIRPSDIVMMDAVTLADDLL